MYIERGRRERERVYVNVIKYVSLGQLTYHGGKSQHVPPKFTGTNGPQPASYARVPLAGGSFCSFSASAASLGNLYATHRQKAIHAQRKTHDFNISRISSIYFMTRKKCNWHYSEKWSMTGRLMKIDLKT